MMMMMIRFQWPLRLCKVKAVMAATHSPCLPPQTHTLCPASACHHIDFVHHNLCQFFNGLFMFVLVFFMKSKIMLNGLFYYARSNIMVIICFYNFSF